MMSNPKESDAAYLSATLIEWPFVPCEGCGRKSTAKVTVRFKVNGVMTDDPQNPHYYCERCNAKMGAAAAASKAAAVVN